MSAFGGKADIHRPDDGARAAVPDETLLDLRCYVTRALKAEVPERDFRVGIVLLLDNISSVLKLRTPTRCRPPLGDECP